MTTEVIEDLELRRILSACYGYWEKEQLPAEKRALCYTWVHNVFKARFGGGFHQSRLEHLARLGFLEKDDTSRGGSRRYYRIVDPDRLATLLRDWSLN